MTSSTEKVPSNPFTTPASTPPPKSVSFAPTDPALSMRVDSLGKKIIAANPQIGMRPLFSTIGDPKPEIFHVSQKGAHIVYVTAGIVGQCKTEAQLAALLSQELGKMVSEREARTKAETRERGGLPPIEVSVRPSGGYGTQDMAYMAEMAKYEKKHPRNPNLPPPDPRYLAQNYLEKAGFQRSDLDSITPLLDAAERNFTWERQFKGGPRQTDWAP